ncbi:hypothetical protein [Streptomyces sp. NPDC048516]|uniref:hypothetical protein n=1 Tax=Streptomyces sp. NPDC048516 TaxID=3365565 RepID=UPI00371E9891
MRNHQPAFALGELRRRYDEVLTDTFGHGRPDLGPGGGSRFLRSAPGPDEQ